MILHAHEFRPAILFGAELHERELVRPHAGGANVADFAGEDEGVEGGHGFLDGHGGVEAVDLEEVDVRGVEAFEGGLDRGKDGLAREACMR